MSNTCSSTNQMITAAQVAEYFAARAEADGSDALARIGVLEAQIAILQGRQLSAMAQWVSDSMLCHEADRPVRDDPRAVPAGRAGQAGGEAEYAERSAYAEIALELGLTERTCDARVGLAVDLTRRLPATLAAVCSGRITLAKARVIREETINLEPGDLLAAVEAQALAKAEGLTPANLRRATRRIVAKVDAD